MGNIFNQGKDVMMVRYTIRCAAVVLAMGATVFAAGGVIAEWDFSKGTQGWSGNQRVTTFETTADGRTIVRVRAVPEKGKANEAVRAVVAGHFGVAKSRVSVLDTKSRKKRVEIRLS